MTLRSRRSLDVREQLQAARITDTMRAAVSLAHGAGDRANTLVRME